MIWFLLIIFLISNFHAATAGTKAILISYDGYYSTKFRQQNLLPSIKNNNNDGFIYEIDQRPTKFSDFDLIKIEDIYFSNFTQKILNIKEITKISEDKIHFRNLHAAAEALKKVSLPQKVSKHYLDIPQIADLLRADRLWMKGFKGEGINVAVFDTGITRRRTFFRNIKSLHDFTNEGNSADSIGHGTFVAGLIASSRRRCSGIAPKANLHIYKVFTHQQMSTTAWFLDAFNMALQSKVHIINLSIGGPDFTDEAFTAKVQEITENGIILISAIGNDGPTFGTLNNPADQGDVIGVGGINLQDKIAKFSSRGMTTWELPNGYGRVKPDIVTYGSQIYGPALYGNCRILSGTSVAAPIVTGAVALLLSSIPENKRRNIAMIKQILIDGANKLDNNGASMFEQGAGRLDLPASFYYLQNYKPKISFFPSYIDYLECPYMWPYCSQPLYADALPIIFNITTLNGFGIGGRVIEPPIFEPFVDENGSFLNVNIGYSNIIWPWSGYLAIFITIKSEASNFDGIASGQIKLKIETNRQISEAIFKFRIKIIPTPPKSKRILWDQFRNMRYPPGYIPRDNLEQKNSPLDWHADHPHTNFKDFYDHLRNQGFYIEIIGQPLTCLKNISSKYSILFIVDSEEEFFPQEIEILKNAVFDGGLNLMIFADWFNSTLIQKVQFLDDNTGKLWYPETGGSNIPALNSLLKVFGFAMGDIILNGKIDGFGGSDGNQINFLSGSTIIRAPKNAKLGFANLNDIGSEFIYGTKIKRDLPVFGISKYENTGGNGGDGMVSIFGDSNCLEDGSCFGFVDDILNAAMKNDGNLPSELEKNLVQSTLPELSSSSIIAKEQNIFLLPQRIIASNFAKYSNVISSFNLSSSDEPIFRTLPLCRRWSSSNLSKIQPLKNVTFELDLKLNQNSLDVIEIERLLGPRMLSNFDAILDENAAGLPPDDYSLSTFDSEIIGPKIRKFFYFFLVAFIIGAAIVARPRTVAQIFFIRPLRGFITIWYKVSNYF